MVFIYFYANRSANCQVRKHYIFWIKIEVKFKMNMLIRSLRELITLLGSHCDPKKYNRTSSDELVTVDSLIQSAKISNLLN